MDVVVVHYHLNRGGVTRVIESHLAGLADVEPAQRPNSVTILFGGRQDGWDPGLESRLPFPVARRAVPSLEYDSLRRPSDDGQSSAGQSLDGRVAQLLDEMLTALNASGHQPDSTVIHVHNHGLGKNASLLQVIHELAVRGWHFLLHVHDFAEELRPDNYQLLSQNFASIGELQNRLYPLTSHVHYATLTNRDAQVLRDASLPSDRVHLLPNPVLKKSWGANRLAAREKLRDRFGVPLDRPFVLYPVRGIRRKNVGELLLWSAVIPGIHFAITLAPKNPIERRSFDEWQELAYELNLPIVFGVGEDEGLTLEENYAAADAVITTSIAEGFGLVFLEAFQAGLNLCGRDLPQVTADFRQSGLQFPNLAAALEVPAAVIDQKRLESVYLELSGALASGYGSEAFAKSDVEASIVKLLRQPFLDFARLDRLGQAKLVRDVVANVELRDQLRDQNPVFDKLAELLKSDAERETAILNQNQQAIDRRYGLAAIGSRYVEICRCVLSAEVGVEATHSLVGRALLAHFLRPESVYPIRLEV